ncbi:MAG: NUDIX domain-containing protein [Longimicrobiales bacterium]|nr:NUDIX domain-containing protein [Longimicrobiales bacterium]
MADPSPSDPEKATVEESAGGVVVRTIEGVVHALLIRDPYRKWGLPKGHGRGRESTREAALREVREETGLEDLRLGAELITIDWAFRKDGRRIHKYATFFLMFSDRGEPIPEEQEGITECRWVPLEAAPGEISYDNASEVARVAREVVLGSA